MTPESRMAIRLRAMQACPHITEGMIRRPCLECEVVAAIAEEREACAKLSRAWAMDIDNVVAALKAARQGSDGGDMHDALLFTANGIAAAIRART